MSSSSRSRSEGLKIFRKMQLDAITTEQRFKDREKNMAQRSFHERELRKIITENIKHQIENKEKQGYSREEVINGLLNTDSKMYVEILEAVVKRTNLTVSLKDAATKRAIKDGKDVMLINPKGNSLDAQIRRFFSDQILCLRNKLFDKEKKSDVGDDGSPESR